MGTHRGTTPTASRAPVDATDGEKAVVPRGAVRRRQIAEVAEGMFLTHGYGDTTMSMVADAAGSSKVTLYRQFGSKEGLFAEVVRNRAEKLNGGVRSILGASGELGVVLRSLGVTLLTELTSPPVVALLRMVVAEAPRDPNLGRVLHAHGPAVGEAKLADYLGRERERGRFKGEDLPLAADVFLSALVGHVILDHLLLAEDALRSPDDIAQRVESVVSMFLTTYGVGSTEKDA